MRFDFLILLALLAGALCFADGAWLPSSLSRLQVNMLAVAPGVDVGSPSIQREFTLDFSRPDVVTTYSPAMYSSEYADILGVTSDVYEVGGKRVRLETNYDPNLNSPMVCPRCHGLFGAGPTSPLWLFYKTVRADARGFTFDVPAVTDGLVCGGTGLCNAVMDVVVTNPDGSVAYAGPHEVVVLMQESRTLLPAAVYNAVRGTRIPGRTPLEEWPTLALSGTGSAAEFTPSEYLRSRPGDTMTTFSFGKSPDARIILGHEAFLALGVVRDWTTGKAIIYDVIIIAENGALTLVLLILMAMAYGLGHRSPTFFLPFEPGRFGQYFTVIVVEIVAVGLAPGLLLSSRVTNVLFRETGWAVVLCCAVGYFSLTVFFSRLHKTLFESSFQRHLWAIVRDGSRGGALVMALFLLALQTSAARWYTPLSLGVLVLAGYEFVHVWRNALAYGWRFSFESFFWLWFAGYFAFSVAALTVMGRNVLLIATQWLFPAGGTPYWLLTLALAALGLAFFTYISRADIARIWRWVMLPATDPKIDRPARRFGY